MITECRFVDVTASDEPYIALSLNDNDLQEAWIIHTLGFSAVLCSSSIHSQIRKCVEKSGANCKSVLKSWPLSTTTTSGRATGVSGVAIATQDFRNCHIKMQ